MKFWVADNDGSLSEATHEEVAAEFPELPIATLDHGELVVCRTKAGTAAFRVPTPGEYERFLGGLLDDRKDQKVKAGKILSLSCIVHPTKEQFSDWIKQYPGIPSACTKPLNKLMGGELADRGKE